MIADRVSWKITNILVRLFLDFELLCRNKLDELVVDSLIAGYIPVISPINPENKIKKGNCRIVVLKFKFIGELSKDSNVGAIKKLMIIAKKAVISDINKDSRINSVLIFIKLAPIIFRIAISLVLYCDFIMKMLE